MVCDIQLKADCQVHCILFFIPRNDRGEVVQKMGDDEGIIYADIGKFDP